MTESDEEAALLGRIAVRHGFITMEQLAECTVERGRGGKKLGAIMLEKSMLSELQLAKVLALQKRHREALTKKVTERQPTPRRRIPTPKDWVATEPNDARPRQLPRRQRQTADVVRDKLVESQQPEGLSPSPPVGPSPPPPVGPGDDQVARRERAERPTPPPSRPPPRSERRTPHDRPTPMPLESDMPPAIAGPPSPPPVGPAPVAPASIGPESESPPRANRPTPREVPTPPSARRVVEPMAVDDPSPERVHEHLIERQKSFEERERSHGASLPLAAVDDRLEPHPWTPPAATPEVAFLHKMLEYAASSRASDVHVHAGMVAKMRQYGTLVPITDDALSADACETLLSSMLTRWQWGRLQRDGELDIAYEVAGLGRFRANIYRQQRGLNGVFHVIPSAPPSLASLGLPEALAMLTNYAQGLILLTGPGGSGKTSTLAALVDIINTERADHILTIEDPVEYVHPSKRCIVNQRQVGRHTESFARGLRAALREDPDIICIGELRDLETISLALSAAETGHLVLATLHTGSAIGTVNRVVGAYPPAQQPQVRAMMSESLRAVTSQRLLPAADGHGVVPAMEVLYVDKAVGSLIRDNRTFQIHSVMQTGRSKGMQLLDTSIKELLDTHKIKRDVAELNVNDPRVLG